MRYLALAVLVLSSFGVARADSSNDPTSFTFTIAANVAECAVVHPSFPCVPFSGGGTFTTTGPMPYQLIFSVQYVTSISGDIDAGGTDFPFSESFGDCVQGQSFTCGLLNTAGLNVAPGNPIYFDFLSVLNLGNNDRIEFLDSGPNGTFVYFPPNLVLEPVTITLTAAPMPEPTLLSMMLIGLAALGAIGYRRRTT